MTTRTKKFPLWAHQNGQFCKVIDGRRHYFGVISDPAAALAKYEALIRGEEVQGDKVSDLIRCWLRDKKRLVPDELKPETLANYTSICGRIKRLIGHRVISSLTKDDFVQLRDDLAKGVELNTLQHRLTVLRMILAYAVDEGYNLNYKKSLKTPSAKNLRRARLAKGPQDFTHAEVTRLLQCEGQLRLSVLLGLNLAYGPTDIAELPLSAIQGEWCDYPRLKAGVERKGWLWPETREALKGFTGWANRRQVSYEFEAHRKSLGIIGRGFRGLRKTFATVASELGNPFAVNHVMGHTLRDVPSLYRQRVSDEQIKRVCEYVRDWTFSEKPAPA